MANHPGGRRRETLRIDARGGRLAWPTGPVGLEDGSSVRFCRAGGEEGGGAFHLGLFVDKAAVIPERVLWPPSRRVAWLVESPEERWFRKVPAVAAGYRRVLTSDAALLARGAPYERFHYGTAFAAPSSTPKTRLVSMVASLRDKFSGHRFRLEALERLRGRPGVDCLGRGHRPIATKNEALDAYAFSVAIENCRSDEYFTEKLVDCFLTETVPVYWGAPCVVRLFDPRGLLPFATLGELEEVVAGLSFDLYERMRPFVLENRRRVEALELDTPGFWRRVARVLAREAEGLEAVARPAGRRALAGACAGARTFFDSFTVRSPWRRWLRR